MMTKPGYFHCAIPPWLAGRTQVWDLEIFLVSYFLASFITFLPLYKLLILRYPIQKRWTVSVMGHPQILPRLVWQFYPDKKAPLEGFQGKFLWNRRDLSWAWKDNSAFRQSRYLGYRVERSIDLKVSSQGNVVCVGIAFREEQWRRLVGPGLRVHVGK